MPRVPKPLDLERLADEHLSGTSLRTLARREGVNPHRVADELRAAGHFVRSRSQATSQANALREHGLSKAKGNTTYMRDLRKKKMRIVQQFRNERGCEECGEKHPAVLDMHHLDPETKHHALKIQPSKNGRRRYGSGRGWTFMSYTDIYEELAKCTVLCSNCHRIHTWTERVRNGGS